jgi:Leucine-rich repeat (LRR) protein
MSDRTGHLQWTIAPPSEPRTLSFPLDRNMGRLYVRPWQGVTTSVFTAFAPNPEWASLANAQGTVIVPAKYEAQLIVNQQGAVDLSPLDDLPPDGLQVLRLYYARRAVGDSQLAHIGRLTGLYALEAHGDHITETGLRAILGLAHLHRLWLGGAEGQSALRAEDIAQLEYLPALMSLDLADIPIRSDVLGRLKHLEELRLDQAPLGRSPGERTDKFAGLSELQRLRKLTIRSTGLRDTSLADLPSLTYLESLDLSGTSITGSGLSRLTGLPRLRELNVSRTLIDDEGLAHLSGCRKLQVLNLGATPITDSGLPYIANIPQLRSLVLADQQFGVQGLTALWSAPKIEHINLSAVSLAEDGLAGIENLTHLRELELNWTQVGDREAQYIGRLNSLQRLALAETLVSDVGMQAIAHLRSLERLDISYTATTGVGLRHIAHLAHLKELIVTATDVDDNGLESIARLQDLRLLEMSRCGRVSDAGLQYLSQLAQLESLSLDATKFSQGSLTWLRPLSNLKSLYLSHVSAGNLKNLMLPGLAFLSISSSELNDLDAASIERSPGLEWLWLEETSTSHAVWSAIGALPRLRILWARSCPMDEAQAFHISRQVAHLTSLGEADFSKTAITDNVLPSLAQLPMLSRLTLAGTEISDAGLPSLGAMQMLDELTVTSTKMTQAGKASLRRALPNCWSLL